MELRELSIQSVSDRALYENLINQCFTVPDGGSYFDDFPIWRTHHPDVIRMGAFNGNTLTGVGGLRVTTLKIGSKQYRIGLIGSIATSPDYRNKRIASSIIQHLVQIADLKKLSACFLWGSEFSLYERFGFRMAGMQARVSLKDLMDQPSYGAVEVKPVSASSVTELRKNLDGGLLIQPKNDLFYLAHKNTEFCAAFENGSPTAYAAIGRGIDLPNLIHEWGGTPTGLASIWNFLKNLSSELGLLFHPELHSSLILASPEKWILEDLCMARFNDEELEAHESLIWFWGLDGA